MCLRDFHIHIVGTTDVNRKLTTNPPPGSPTRSTVRPVTLPTVTTFDEPTRLFTMASVLLGPTF